MLTGFVGGGTETMARATDIPSFKRGVSVVSPSCRLPVLERSRRGVAAYGHGTAHLQKDTMFYAGFERGYDAQIILHSRHMVKRP